MICHLFARAIHSLGLWHLFVSVSYKNYVTKLPAFLWKKKSYGIDWECTKKVLSKLEIICTQMRFTVHFIDILYSYTILYLYVCSEAPYNHEPLTCKPNSWLEFGMSIYWLELAWQYRVLANLIPWIQNFSPESPPCLKLWIYISDVTWEIYRLYALNLADSINILSLSRVLSQLNSGRGTAGWWHEL